MTLPRSPGRRRSSKADLVGRERSGPHRLPASAPGARIRGLLPCLAAVLAAAVTMAEVRPRAAASPAGPNPFEYLDYGGTRSHGHSLTAGDPVAMSSGAYFFSLPLLSLGGDVPLAATLHYRTDLQHAGFGLLMRLPTTFWLEPFMSLHLDRTAGDATYATAQVGTGDWVSFKKAEGVWELAGAEETVAGNVFSNNGSPIRWALVAGADYAYLMDPVRERVYVCQRSNYTVNGSRRLSYVLDRNGNFLRFVYPSVMTNDPSRIEDGKGRVFDVTYQTVNLNPALATISDQCGRTVSFNLEHDPADNPGRVTLRGIARPAAGSTTFAYAGANLVSSLTTGAARVPTTQTYGVQTLNGTTADRVVSQTDGAGNTTTFAYDPAASLVTATYADGSVETYGHHGHHSLPSSFTDGAGNTGTFTKNDREQLTSITDREGGATSFSYHAETGKLASTTDANGHTTSYTYTPRVQTFANPILPSETIDFTFYDLTRVDYADGAFETFTYDGRGNVLTRTDRAGGTWTYTYDASGRVLSETNPTGGVRTNAYNADGTLASAHDSDTGLTTFTYDACKRVTRVDLPDGSFETYAYDGADRVTQVVDGLGTTTMIEYDADGNPTRVVRADGTAASQETLRQYDVLGRVSSSTGPLGATATFAYTHWSGVSQLTRPGGGTLTVEYDQRRWISGLRDELDNHAELARDKEGVPAGATSPLGRTVALGTDNLGATVTLTDPRGNSLAFDRDALGRVVKVTDRNGNESTIVRDGQGRITTIATPLTGTVTYTRNALGLVTRITDQRGSHWDFTYTPAGRRSGATDPLGRSTAYAWDTSGRLSQITHPDGVVETRTYDAAGNVLDRGFTGGLTLGFTYDALGRMTASASAPVTVAYDARDRVTATTMAGATVAATWNAADTLASLDVAGQTTVSYEHDARGLVTEVSDSASGAWVHLTWDADRQLARIERSNGITTEIERNANGSITRIRHGGHGQLDFTFDADDAITAIAESLPLDVTAFLAPELESWAYDAANQTSAAGFTHDARGRRTADPRRTYSWDAADRLVAIGYDGTNVGCEYTASGELVRRTVAGVTIDYVRSYSIPGRPIVAEKRNGAWHRYFVHTPQGRLLYVVPAATPSTPSFFHFNHIGTTLFLTDAAGEVTDTYGYTPYGRMVRHEGTSDQPFTFVGELGVLREGSSGLFHMRARVFDSLTARFVSRDPRWPDLDDPRALNPYQYAAQSPLSLIDPSGESYWVGVSGDPILDPTGAPLQADDPGFPRIPGLVVGEVHDDGSLVWHMWRASYYYEPGRSFEYRRRWDAVLERPAVANRRALPGKVSEKYGIDAVRPGSAPVVPLTHEEHEALKELSCAAQWAPLLNCSLLLPAQRNAAPLLGLLVFAFFPIGYVLARRWLTRQPRRS